MIDEIDLLPILLGEIAIPEMVYRELNAPSTPDKIKRYLDRKPDWLSVRKVKPIIDQQLQDIDPGERDAILLAEELSADGILIDDMDGRTVALERGLRVLGTLGFLELADSEGLLNFLDSLDQIKAAGFFVSKWLEQELRSAHGGGSNA
ncbi:MAG: DUF3368 domain-containing protein [Acidobacteria bacterium]|nr:DUF3368 domain-containing protein [Acidobacteriota bacterium]